MRKNHRMKEPEFTMSKENFRQLFDNAYEAIFLDLNGQIKFANKKFYRIFELEKSDQDESSWLDLINPEDKKDLYPQKKLPATHQNHTEATILKIMTKSGMEKWIEINQVLLNWEGEPAILNFIRDITRQKRLESRLQIAKKIEIIGALAGGIAHDLNNILSPIIGYTELALDEINQDSLAFKNLNRVYKAAESARNLVQQMLVFSRQSKKESKPIMIQNVINEALKLLGTSIPSTIEFNAEINKNCPPVMADPYQIHQIVINLCSNACHAMKDTGGILSIKVTDVDITQENAVHFGDIEKGKYVRLSVSDRGHGMDQNLIQRIFEPFFSTKEKGLWTGLGLSIVQAIVQNHNGYIDVYSAPNQGTTFHIYFPIIISDEITIDSKKENQITGGKK